jgi:hypothetical protein
MHSSFFFFFHFFHFSFSSVFTLPSSEPSSSFHNISVNDRHLYLNSTASASSIPCGYMIPTELDIFRYVHLRSQTRAIPTVAAKEFNPDKCTVMIVRLLFGAYELFSPKARSHLKLPLHRRRTDTICYLLITDELSFQHPLIAEGILEQQTSMTPWHVFVMKNLIYPNPAKTMKTIKLSLFRLFPYAKYILYYDLKYRLIGDPMTFIAICDRYMKQENVSHAIYRHFAQKLIAEEFSAAQHQLKVQHTKGVVQNISEELRDIARQQKQYRAEGFFDMIKEQKPVLVDSAILLFKNHEPTLHRFFCAWMNEVILFSRRDQLSYPYVEYKLNLTGFKIPGTFISRYFRKISHQYVSRFSNKSVIVKR